MHFIDEVKIYLKSGNGGNGCLSFRREKFIEFGGPDGGNGGKGGDIVFRTVSGLNTLIDFRYKQHFKAESGKAGMGQNRTGSSGRDLLIDVPVGTQIYDEDGQNLIYDLEKNGELFILMSGGRGGAGNINFKSSTNQAPRRATPGQEGQEMWVRLQLKLLSDVGLIGLPNAGKSTFLSTTTSAKPKIADYAFTTLKPQLGVVYSNEKSFVLADIPGLIEGASEGHGLGDKFLKHIERCRVLLHLIDVREDVCKAYNTIRHELQHYVRDLSYKPEILALNKIDLLSPDEVNEKRMRLEALTKKDVLLCSGVTKSGVSKILDMLCHLV